MCYILRYMDIHYSNHYKYMHNFHMYNQYDNLHPPFDSHKLSLLNHTYMSTLKQHTPIRLMNTQCHMCRTSKQYRPTHMKYMLNMYYMYRILNYKNTLNLYHTHQNICHKYNLQNNQHRNHSYTHQDTQYMKDILDSLCYIHTHYLKYIQNLYYSYSCTHRSYMMLHM